MTNCFTYCFGCQDIWKADKLKVRALNMYYSSSFPIVMGNYENNSLLTSNSIEFCEKASNCLYMIRILSYSKILDFHTTTKLLNISS